MAGKVVYVGPLHAMAGRDPAYLHENFMSGTTKRDWPENSVFAYLWQTAEDRVLSHIETHVTEHLCPRTPVLTHRRVHVASQDVAWTRLTESLEDHVLRRTGLSVTLAYKDHASWLEQVLLENPVGNVVSFAEADELFWLDPSRAVRLSSV